MFRPRSLRSRRRNWTQEAVRPHRRSQTADTVGAIDIDLVVSDLDGTLWQSDHDLPARTRHAIAELDRRGVPLLIATGRRVQSTATPLRSFGLTPPAVMLNGALGIDLATAERFHHATIAPAAARGVLDAFRSAGLEPCIYVDHEAVEVFLAAVPSTHPDHVASLGGHADRDDLDRVVAEEHVLAFSVIGRPQDELALVRQYLGVHGVAHLNRVPDFGGYSLTVAGPGMSKWEGVVAYCAHAGLDAAKVLAIGDGENDLELLAGAAIAVAPADADPVVREFAQHIVGRAADGGWADLIDLLEP